MPKRRVAHREYDQDHRSSPSVSLLYLPHSAQNQANLSHENEAGVADEREYEDK